MTTQRNKSDMRTYWAQMAENREIAARDARWDSKVQRVEDRRAEEYRLKKKSFLERSENDE